MLFSLCACSSEEKTELPTENNYDDIAPVLGAEVENSENIGFYALTKNGTYSWEYIDKNGKKVYVEHDGYFCLDDTESLCTFTREQTGGSITLKFSGSVSDYKIYQAPCEEIENDKTKILDDKYLVSTSSKTITFPESGEYYYVVNVNYDQGEVPYGFLLAE